MRRTIRSVKESSIERPVVADAKDKLGVLSIKLAAGQGMPDRLFLIPGGRGLLIEFKAPGADPRPLQDAMHVILRGLDYDTEVHDNYDEAMAAIRRRLK